MSERRTFLTVRTLTTVFFCAICMLVMAAFLHSDAAYGRTPPIPRTELVIDVGHGGVDGGTSAGTVLEKDINLAVGMKLYKELRKTNCSFVVNRLQDYAMSDDNRWLRSTRHRRDLAQRCEIANRLKPDYVISLHVNWSRDRSETGPLMIYQKRSEAAQKLARQLQTALNRLYGTETKPVPGRKYYLLKHTEAPAVIVEMGYLSNAQDLERLLSPKFQEELARTIGQTAVDAVRGKSSESKEDR